MDENQILDRISEALRAFDDRVFYGAVPASSFDEADPWDFIVFQREGAPVSRNATSQAKAYRVSIAREGYVPEGMEEDVIEALCSLPGVKLAADANIEFDYSINPNSQESVEMCSIHFRRGAKV